MTGKPGVAAVTAGPGVTNTVTAVKNAQMAQSPVLIFGGATATVLKGRGSLQDIDQLSLMTANVLALLDAPQRAAELGQAAASRAREKHTWNRVIDGWLRAYESAVAGA